MARLEDITPGARVRGIRPGQVVAVLAAKPFGMAVQVTFRDEAGRVSEEALFRDREPQLEVESPGLPWAFDADPATFQRVLEAYRISLASLFDPVLAVHTSLVVPLPHQILAVYESMLPRQPLRFLLADDPGAGKTIMAGLFIRELMVRGDLERCLIVAPGSLCEQWQDELGDKFNLDFEIATNDKMQASRSGNWFKETPLVIGRLDRLSRDEAVVAQLRDCEWDLVVVDEAHKMSGSFFGGEAKFTKRFRLGEALGPTTRHLLLMTATPHNGKDEDFQIFLSLLDADRFEGRFRSKADSGAPDARDLMRRLTKELLLKFDGTPLFPERKAYVVPFELSDPEAALYAAVTKYVNEEFNRADRLDEGKKVTVGFALMVLQRRLASSPAAIYHSLKRRRERLEAKLRETTTVKKGQATDFFKEFNLPSDFDDDDLDDLAADESESTETEVADKATAAQTIAELQAEIRTLAELERMADAVRRSGRDTKWSQLRELLLNQPLMRDAEGQQRKLVIFTEQRDTLDYLAEQIRTLLGSHESVVTIAGNMARQDRRKSQELFRNEKDVAVLVATDAAGEGINLQRAHLMVNYDLPWNPNRLEQRFGRIHRIGQQEVCHLWNLLAKNTREGEVYLRLLDKLRTAREALDGKVFDVLGQVLEGRQLRELLVEAIRYGDRPEVQRRLFERVDNAAEQAQAKGAFGRDALVTDVMDTSRIQAIREDMERANLRRLQPHFIEQFFLPSFTALGGRIIARGDRLHEVTHVPARVCERATQLGTRLPVVPHYERVTFHKDLAGPKVEFLCPGHPLFDATLATTLEDSRSVLKQGSVLVDPVTDDESPYALVTLSHQIRDNDPSFNKGDGRVVSKRVQFLRLYDDGRIEDAGHAPHLDLRIPTIEESQLADTMLEDGTLGRSIEDRAVTYAIEHLVPKHRIEVEPERLERLKNVRAKVTQRLKHEIQFWDGRAATLREQQSAGKQPSINPTAAERRRDELEARLDRRLRLLDQQMQFSSGVPLVESGAFVVPQVLLERLTRDRRGDPEPARPSAAERDRIDQLAVRTVMATEVALGRRPTEMPHENPGYDIESRVLKDGMPTGELYFLEVKGKSIGVDTVTVSATQITQSFNAPDRFILAIVPVDGDRAKPPRYVRRPFADIRIDRSVASTNFKMSELLSRSEEPR
jgi:superfamily II DNA or RNA helicase